MPSNNHPTVKHYDDGTASVLRKAVVYTELRFYQRSDVLYQLTQVFCQRYLPRYGDRTVDQMIQAARSTKQNIAEGSTDGQTSIETELKLLGIARGSNQELLEDYQDYLKRKGMTEWFGHNKRFDRLHQFCRDHCQWIDYQSLLLKMSDEELANMAGCTRVHINRLRHGKFPMGKVNLETLLKLFPNMYFLFTNVDLSTTYKCDK